MEGEEANQGDQSDDKVKLPPPKKRGRKKVAKSKQVKKAKERGKYSRGGSVIGQNDQDLTECLFSDDESRLEYELLNVGNDTMSHDGSSEPSTSVDSSMSSTSILSLSVSGSDVSRLSTSMSSRPPSALSRAPSAQEVCDISEPSSDFSRPSSSLSSRPPSAMSRPPSAVEVSDQTIQDPSDCEAYSEPSIELITNALTILRNLLPTPWIPIADRAGFHLLLISAKTPKAIQREIFISYGGNLQILMHCKVIPSFKSLFKIESRSLTVFSEDSINDYCDFCLFLVQTFLQFEACLGVNDPDTKEVWTKLPGAVIDLNPYHEEKYAETCRSVTCGIVIKLGIGKRCSECAKLKKKLMQRKEFLLSPVADPSTTNKNLTHEQALKKLEAQHKEIRKKDKQISYLKSRVAAVLESEGVNIDGDLNEIFSSIVMSSNKLTEVQKIFLQEQWASAHASDSRAHKWHPVMIRLALNMYMRGGGNYNTTRDLGFIRLPHSRTMFDYAHSIKATHGINEELVKLVYERVQVLNEHMKEYHVVLADGMHVSQNLVYKAMDGELVGFVKLDDIDKELEKLESYIEGNEPRQKDPQLATEVLAFMVKGIASDVKCVVASYPMKVLSKGQLYKRSWDVIRHLEVAGIKVLAFVCDGHPVNRAFFKMHSPHSTDTKFDIVFDTINFCASELRLLFLISDLCHILKTLRNAFYNSGDHPKKPRLLTYHDEVIVWKFIVRLYFTFKNDNFRKSYKLSALNVFPNSYSRMKVLPAAQVLSNTVGQDLEDQNWPGTKETIRFIRLANRFFDCLNGAHTSQAKRKRNNDLAPYTVENIDYELREGRFKFLREFIEYLAEWKADVDSLPVHPSDREKMLLPMQTMIGIETTIRAIEGATKYFLDPNGGQGKFINARIFSQDPLEHHFGDQRQGGGGSRNPNVAQFQQKQVACALQRGLNVKKRRANSAEGDFGMVFSDEPVPKKKRSGRK